MQPDEKPALIIIDMVKDNFDDSRNLPITPLARKIIPPLNQLSAFFRRWGWPVVFSTDAFRDDDFIFQGRMHPHSLAGTSGAEVVDELIRQNTDLWLPKPKFSAFFQTELEVWLRERNVTLCAIGGISTHFCVLTTVLDAICHNFKAVLLEDCSTASTLEIHERTVNTYRRNPLYPLLRVATSSELVEELDGMTNVD
ncbi:MAG: isochorismatase family cysteine hydrolase [Desulfobacterales bacterium]|nr:isochorismatase family cysteine hydrolase [Desulfobacterales bacterium]